VTLTGLLITLRWQSALASFARYHQFLTESGRHLLLAYPALDRDIRDRIAGLIRNAITVPGSRPPHYCR
jgi:hypothetical protein